VALHPPFWLAHEVTEKAATAIRAIIKILLFILWVFKVKKLPDEIMHQEIQRSGLRNIKIG
jgi:hypothetical protein